MDPIVPRCVRENTDPRARAPWHSCAELCEVAHGQPCQPPAGSGWRPRSTLHGMPDVRPGSAVANYRLMREALGPGELTEQQQRFLRWLAGWDDPTAQGMASLFRFARGER